MKKRTVAAIILAGLIGGLVLLIFFGLGFFLSPQDNLQKADAIVVISGGRTTARAQKGIQLFKDGYGKKLILSGAALDDGPSNALAMRDQALSAGIADQDILIDEAAQDTYQNAIDSKHILDQLDARSLILVTSPYHQRRADMTFRAVLGPAYKVIGVSAFDDRWSKAAWWKSGFAFDISLSELQKLVFIYLTGSYQ
ncbi:YdcF family protein [Candidatus Saccharibacteria bacterium]|nr:YdcF family protein [Candidatus Saccharibacteria bacterium]